MKWLIGLLAVLALAVAALLISRMPGEAAIRLAGYAASAAFAALAGYVLRRRGGRQQRKDRAR